MVITRKKATFALLAISNSFQNVLVCVQGDKYQPIGSSRTKRRLDRSRRPSDFENQESRIVTLDAMSEVMANSSKKGSQKPFGKKKFEVWASDQSNSVQGETSAGVNGSYLWIWSSNEIAKLLATGEDAVPLGCPEDSMDQKKGPCDVYDVFPKDELKDQSGNYLKDLDNFGRLHGMLTDPSNRYVTANMFALGGGYVGIIDTKTRAAIGLFRITKFKYGTVETRSNHMSYFSEDGKHIIIANLHGKAVERIDITRDDEGIIIGLSFNKSASLGLGKGMSVTEEATFFSGPNALDVDLLGEVTGDYSDADLGDLTPNGKCKENGCSDGADGEMGGRSNNLVICPIASKAGNAYVTLAGGGLLVVDIDSTPMRIIGEYGKGIIYGAGCGGVQTKDEQVFLNAGISASGAGAKQSMFALYSIDDTQFPTDGVSSNPENTPMPKFVYQDTLTNTKSNGNVEGREELTDEEAKTIGQLPYDTDRRDSHGAEVTLDNKYVHVVDRIQNVVEVFDTETSERFTYDLTSTTGKTGRDGPAGPCWKRSVMDDAGLPRNDPAPDLMSIEPNGEYIMVALRGPYPVSVNHSAQGSCPGVGIIQITEGGKSGRLVEVLRTSNTVDNVEFKDSSAPGGHKYIGAERSDVHGAVVIARDEDD